MGIDTAVELAKQHEVSGVNKVIVIVSSDGTSSDDPLPAAEIARDEYNNNILTVSIREPSSTTLKELSSNSPTR